MTQEEKELLIKDLCARLPYGVEVSLTDGTYGMVTSISIVPHGTFATVYFNRDDVKDVSLEEIKPYLRPISSITQEEYKEFNKKYDIEYDYLLNGKPGHTVESAAMNAFEIDFYNSHHIDYRGLIEMGLALEATKDIYKTE